jgi:hypothetical protein
MKTEILKYKDCYYTSIIINDVAFFIFSKGENITFFTLNIYCSIEYSVEKAYRQFITDNQMRKQYYSIKENHKPLIIK